MKLSISDYAAGGLGAALILIIGTRLGLSPSVATAIAVGGVISWFFIWPGTRKAG